MTKEDLKKLNQLLAKYFEKEKARGRYELRFFWEETCHECGGILALQQAIDADIKEMENEKA